MADRNFVLDGLDWENIFASSQLESDLPWHGGFSEIESIYITGKTSYSSAHTSSILPSPFSSNVTNFQLPMVSMQERDQVDTPVDSNAVIPANTSDGSLDSSGYNQDTPVSSHHFSTSEASFANPSAGSLSRKKKKRDPRLQCPNFLAGRIPCSCPEEEELEADVEVEAAAVKRSKVGARCQVPSCGEDISHLKGYHQRHRVCLACANSREVMLKDFPHRYCQQCGKFHRLSDFDEGKRSCRRKLERHNILRRRRPAEEEADAQLCEAQLLEVDADCSVTPLEGAAAKNANSVVALREQRHSKTMANVKQKTTDDHRTSDNTSGSTRRSEDDIISSKLDEPYLPNARMGNGTGHTEEDSRNMKPSYKQQPRPGFYKSAGHYVSDCPSGRISFKLYDWNPADFPRRLRQQIFDWLASMPVELESYVRSGCVILTFFATMPQFMWSKVLAEWQGQMQTLILTSGVKLLGTGQITTQMVKKHLIMKNGKVASACHKDLLVPFVVDLYPRSLEAGCSTQVYVVGFNFTGGRFLLSFGEHYVECKDWQSVDSRSSSRQVGSSVGNVEVHRVTVFLPDSEKFGVAYVEVENVHGLSNFMPLVVADKPICLEINKLNFGSTIAFNICINDCHKEVKSLRSQHRMDLLIDLGWALKHANRAMPNVNLEARAAVTHRLQTLLFFLLEHSCHTITQRLFQTFSINFVSRNVLCIKGFDLWSNATKLKGMKTKSISGVLVISIDTAAKSELILGLSAEADGNEIDKQRKIKLVKGQQEPKVEADQSLKRTLVEGSHRNKTDAWPNRLPLLEERISIAKDGWRHKTFWAESFSWQKKRLETTGILPLFNGNKRSARILTAVVGIVTVCAGMCFMLQHPHEVADISMSLRRCLWGSNAVLLV